MSYGVGGFVYSGECLALCLAVRYAARYDGAWTP